MGRSLVIVFIFSLLACALPDRHWFEGNDYLIASPSALPLALKGTVRRMNHEDPKSTLPTLLVMATMTALPDHKGIAEFSRSVGLDKMETIRTQYFYKSRIAEAADLANLKENDLVICFGQDNIAPPLSRLNSQRTTWFMTRAKGVDLEKRRVKFPNGNGCPWERMRLPLS